jgi:two-component system sensor histidine kinase/response regulator
MNGKRHIILVIDDEAAMRDACLQVLRKDGYEADEAEDGIKGMEKTKELRPDVALVDLKMPGMEGMEVLLKLKNIDPDIILIVITGYATIESAVEAMKRGAYDFLAKPFSPDQLRITISRALESREAARERDALQREKKLMEKNFITMVSHQMRSPLVTIAQYLESLLAGGAGDLTGEQARILSRVKARLEATLTMINDWLSMARVDKGALAERFEQVPIADLVKNLAEFMQPAAGKKGVTITVEAPGDLTPVPGDRASLEQVFTNILTNAVNYNREGGSVSIEMKNEGDGVSISVADTGVGIAKEHLADIFNEFYRIKSKDGALAAGSGLGLSIAKKIIDAHNGSIDVRSEPGKGTSFTVTLPGAQKTD